MKWYNDDYDQQDILTWQGEALDLVVKYGRGAAISTLTSLFDDKSIAFKNDPNPDNWQWLIRAMYMLQHAKNNCSDERVTWELRMREEVKAAEEKLANE